MFLLGIVSLFQAVFLPGFIIYKGFLRLKGGLHLLLPVSFALSMVYNYILVYFLAATGFYCRQMMLWILLFELILAGYLFRDQIKEIAKMEISSSLSFWIKERWGRLYDALDSMLRSGSRTVSPREGQAAFVLSCIITALAAICVLSEVRYIYMSIGNGFGAWDAVLSWNRWAMDWYHGHPPEQSWEYPQVIPVNWSLSYIFMGFPLQFFPKMTIILFPFLIFFMFFVTGLERKSIRFIAAVPVLEMLFRHVNYEELGGDVDVAATFMGLCSILCILRAKWTEFYEESWKWIFAGALIACGSAVTKQSGLMIMALFPLLAWILFLREDLSWKTMNFTAKAYKLMLFVFMAVFMVLPYYAYKKMLFDMQTDQSNVWYVTKAIYGDKGELQRFVIASRLFLAQGIAGDKEVTGARFSSVDLNKGFQALYEFFAPHALDCAIPLALIILLLCYAMKDPFSRWTTLLISLPFYIVWSLYYCYDLRNLSMALPFMALAAGTGVEMILSKFTILSLFGRMRLPVILLIALLIGAYYNWGPANEEAMKKKQAKIEREMGLTNLNNLLYEYHEKHGINKKIISNYEYIGMLPGFEGKLTYHGFEPALDDKYLKFEVEDYFRFINDSEVGFILFPGYANKIVLGDILARMEKGEYTLIFESNGYRFVKINRETDKK